MTNLVKVASFRKEEEGMLPHKRNSNLTTRCTSLLRVKVKKFRREQSTPNIGHGEIRQCVVTGGWGVQQRLR